MVSLETPVEVAPFVVKRLGDCTSADLLGAAAIFETRGRRNREASEQLRAGKAPKCDWRNLDGSYCDRDSEYGCTSTQTTPNDLLSVCAEHSEFI